jgi:2,3-bisphosphoglycerate-independent phosphoglycerate mutase
MKVLFLLIDGIGDVQIPELGSKTPLEYANTLTLDRLAGTLILGLSEASGVTGLMDPVEPGLACGSDTAHMNIFGYPPRK